MYTFTVWYLDAGAIFDFTIILLAASHHVQSMHVLRKISLTLSMRESFLIR
jgi:hypothetical protein